MTSVILAILAFVSIALFGWVIAEVKGNVCNYNATEEEKEAEANAKKNLLKDGYHQYEGLRRRLSSRVSCSFNTRHDHETTAVDHDGDAGPHGFRPAQHL